MKRLIGSLIAAGAMVVALNVGASATAVTVAPWAYGCGATTFANPATKTCLEDSATASYSGGVLTVTKTGPTSGDLAAGATIGGLTHVTAISFDVSGYCGAGAPRLNITTADGKTHFFGCSANNADGHVSINLTAAGDGSGNGGVGPDDVVTAIDVVLDESGSAIISNFTIAGTPAPTPTPTPTATPPATATSTATPHPTVVPVLAQTGGGQADVWPNPWLVIAGAAFGGLLLAVAARLTIFRRRS